MSRAAALGILAFGLTGLFAIACAPTYSETDSASEDNIRETDPSEAQKSKPPAAANGSSTIGTGDAGAPPKSPGNDSDASIALDGGACSKTPSPGGYEIHASRPRAAGACSTADIGYYEGLLAANDQTFGELETALMARSERCASCVFSKFEDTAWTPIVKLDGSSGFYNWGSCYANSPGGSPACASQVQQWFSCLDDACGDCVSDAEYDACVDKASSDPQQCGSLTFAACGSKLTQLNEACDSIAKTIEIACGP